MPTQAKVDRVAELQEKLENSSIVISTGYSGIGVNQMVSLRRRMHEGGVEFIVVKNNLLALAADGADVPQLKDIIAGQTAIALGYDDAAATAKAVNEAANANGTLAIQGAVVNRTEALSADGVTRLASLPGNRCLVAQLLGNMQAPFVRPAFSQTAPSAACLRLAGSHRPTATRRGWPNSNPLSNPENQENSEGHHGSKSEVLDQSRT